MWRVEAIRQGGTSWFRAVNAGAVVADWLSTATLTRVLEERGVDMRDLVEAEHAA